MDGRDIYRDSYLQRLMDQAENDDHTLPRQSPDLQQVGNQWMNTGGLGISLPQMSSSYDAYSKFFLAFAFVLYLHRHQPHSL